MNLKDSFVTLGCIDLNRSVAFYQALLEQPPSVNLVDRYAEFQLPGLRLALFVPSGAHRGEFSGASSPMSLCLEVADLDAAIAHLEAIGHSPAGPVVTASHGREIYAYDPQGNRLILHESR
ncbi:glyoxalase [filamentous cyanobacterium CCP5]|nr:glyoxalase [filamentous cyanobacterium CCP5]